MRQRKHVRRSPPRKTAQVRDILRVNLRVEAQWKRRSNRSSVRWNTCSLQLLRSCPFDPFLTACRARIIRLEQQLKAAQPDPKVTRTWATTLAQDCPAVAAPGAAAKPAGAQLCGSGNGRRASCPEANLPSRSYRAHRQALEEQQRAATEFMSDKSKVRPRCCIDDSLSTQGYESMSPFLLALQPPDLSPKTLENIEEMFCVRSVFLARLCTFRFCLTHQPGLHKRRYHKDFCVLHLPPCGACFYIFIAARVQQSLVSLWVYTYGLRNVNPLERLRLELTAMLQERSRLFTR